MRIIVSLIIALWVFAFGVGCQANPVDTETPLDNIPTPVAPPEQGDATQMSASTTIPADAGLQNLIEKTKEDLAQRLSISITQITLVEATEVEWSDSSLDCPQPGMEYLQVITPGYRIVLQVDDQAYEYHTNQGTYFVYCEYPVPPIFPKP